MAHSGDATTDEMDEIVQQFSAYNGLATGEALSDAAETAWGAQAGQWRAKPVSARASASEPRSRERRRHRCED